MPLVPAVNWTAGCIKERCYICKGCAARRTRLWREARRATSTPPAPIAESSRPAVDPNLLRIRAQQAAFFAEGDRKQSGIIEGYVYIITNTAWPGWVSVGHSTDPERRLSGYNRAGPFRDWTLHDHKHFYDRRVAEREVHRKLTKLGVPRLGEWFQANISDVMGVLQHVYEVHQQRNEG